MSDTTRLGLITELVAMQRPPMGQTDRVSDDYNRALTQAVELIHQYAAGRGLFQMGTEEEVRDATSTANSK